MVKNVMFVDDDLNFLKSIQRALKNKFTEVNFVFVNDPKDAVARILNKKFDVVVSDFNMPKINGVQLLEHIKKKHPKTERIILTGFINDPKILENKDERIQYLEKPCEISEIIAAIESALKRE